MPDVFDLQAHLTMDTSEFEKAMREAAQSGADLARGFEADAKSLEEMKAELERLQKELNQSNEATEDMTKALDETTEAVEEVTESTEDMRKETEKAAESTEEMADEVKDLRKRLDDVTDQYKKSEEKVEQLRKELEKTAKECGENADETKELSKKLDEAEKESRELKEEVDKLQAEYEDTTKSTGEFADATKGVADAADESESSLSGFAEFLKNGLGAAIEASIGLFAAAGAAVVAYTKQAYDAYSSYEQLSGGVDTLFGDASDTVMENANKAWKTTGQSKNEYLEMVTGFSASLLQATGRGEQQDIDQLQKTLDEKYEQTKKAWEKQIKLADSSQKDLLRDQRDADLKRLKEANEAAVKEAEAANAYSVSTAESRQRAAELADLAARDMSDNANKMGTDMESIKNAYQGFAKGNFTMLDNLKLGYGGTKEEMERLLDKAEQLTGKTFAISSFADITEAIHAVQEELYISGLSAEEAAQAVADGVLTDEEAYIKLGTTAKEAGDTVEGSTKAMAALWENLKNDVASGDVEAITKTIEELAGSAETYISNAMPLIENILNGISILVEKAAPVLAEKIPELISNLLPPMLKATVQLLRSAAEALPGLITSLVPAVMGALEDIVAELPDVVPKIIESIGNALISAIDLLENPIENIILDLGEMLRESLPVLIKVIMGLVTSLSGTLGGIIEYLLPEISELVVEIIRAFADMFKSEDTTVAAEAMLGLIKSIGDALVESTEILFDELLPVVFDLLGAFSDYIEANREELGGDLLEALWSLLKGVLGLLADLGLVLISAIILEFGTVILTLLKNIYEPIWGAIIDFFKTVWGAELDFLKDVISGIADFFMNIGESLYNWVEERKEKAKEFFSGILDTIKEYFGYFVEGIVTLKDDAAQKVQDIVDTIKGKITGMIDTAKEWGKDLIENFVGGIKDNIPDVSGAMSTFADKVGEYIHFSEPDKGALSNFHTFAPDMMKLFAEGIKDNASLVYDEINALTTGISNDFTADVPSERSGYATAASNGGVVINIYNTWEGLKLASEFDVEEMSDRAIERMSERLAELDIFSNRAYGRVVMP